MTREEYEKIIKIFAGCKQTTESAIDIVFGQLKCGCRTMADVSKKITALQRHIQWSVDTRRMYNDYVGELRTKLEKEMSNMDIPSCSNVD